MTVSEFLVKLTEVLQNGVEFPGGSNSAFLNTELVFGVENRGGKIAHFPVDLLEVFLSPMLRAVVLSVDDPTALNSHVG